MPTRNRIGLEDLDELRLHCLSMDKDPLELAGLWNLLAEQGLDAQVFYDRSITSAGDFVTFAQDAARLFFCARVSEVPVALFWLDGWGQRRALMHFVAFRNLCGAPCRVLGRYVLDWLFRCSGPGGGTLVDVLVGVTPSNRPLAVKFLRAVGFTVLGEIPLALGVKGGGRCGAVVSYLKRGEE